MLGIEAWEYKRDKRIVRDRVFRVRNVADEPGGVVAEGLDLVPELDVLVED
jgi:hypothetical protein